MITSESNAQEIRRFFNSHSRELNVRLYNLLNKKYRRTFIQLVNRGEELPSVFGTLKVGDITIYGLAFGLKVVKSEVLFSALSCFLIMKDLRRQTRIMVMDVPNNQQFGVIYDTHSISRYKERLGLPEDMDFVDVCKHMCDAGQCGSPRIIADWLSVHGSDHNKKEGRLCCANGVFLGYYSVEKDIFYAETFLSPNELSERQLVLDPTQSENARNWIERINQIKKGEIPYDGSMQGDYIQNVKMEDGEIKYLNDLETAQAIEEINQFYDENPEVLQAQIDANRAKAENRIKRKGYK